MKSAPLTLVKLGGSLITDKRRPGRARRQVIRRLAAEIAEAVKRRPGRLIVGHGSGSFGHPAAARHEVHKGARGGGRPAGAAETQARAATLHRLVSDALLEAGAAPFSLAPSSYMTASAGRPVGLAIEPLLLALGRGLLPVTYGDVVLDRRQGTAICSTETVFHAVVRAPRQQPAVRVVHALGLPQPEHAGYRVPSPRMAGSRITCRKRAPSAQSATVRLSTRSASVRWQWHIHRTTRYLPTCPRTASIYRTGCC